MTLDERITAAIERIRSGAGPMRIPADVTDPDIVLADCREQLAIARASLEALADAVQARDELAAAVAEEREACAKRAEAARNVRSDTHWRLACEYVAADLRGAK